MYCRLNSNNGQMWTMFVYSMYEVIQSPSGYSYYPNYEYV